MNNWVIVGIIFGLLIIGGIALVSAISYSAEQTDTEETSYECGNSCTAGNTCGNPTCGAISGGSCGCGR